MLSGLIAQTFKIALCRSVAIQFLRCKSRVINYTLYPGKKFFKGATGDSAILKIPVVSLKCLLGGSHVYSRRI